MKKVFIFFSVSFLYTTLTFGQAAPAPRGDRGDNTPARAPGDTTGPVREPAPAPRTLSVISNKAIHQVEITPNSDLYSDKNNWYSKLKIQY